MQGGNVSSSSVTSITLEDFVLTEDSSDEIKMRALKILMSKAENAKHRIADLQSVTLADIESGNQSLSHIRQHVTYIVPFLQSIPAEVKGAGQLVDALESYRPRLTALENQLEEERIVLDDFTRALEQLQATKIDTALRTQLLPELPPDEQTGTLSDWANLSELLNTFRLLSDDRNQMLPVAEWGFKQAARLRDKHKILVEELVICEDGSQAMRRMDFNAIAVELDSARETADAVRLECTNHYERTLDVSKRGPRAGDVWQLALSDYNLVQRFYAMGKARARARKLKEDLEELVPAAEVMATRIHALASETVGVVAEAQEMVREFDPLDDDINGYMRPEGDLGIFADLKRSSKAWTEFVAFYDGLVAEMMRRRAVLAKRSALVEQYKKALDDTYDEEMEIRTRFEEQFTRPEVPAIWRLCDPIAEPTTKFDIKPYPILTIIPDLTDHIADREVMRENARRIADTKLQPMIVNHLVTFAETDPRYHQQILQQQMQQQQYELYQQQIRAYQLQQAQNAQSSPLDASRQVYQPSFQYEPRPIASPSQSPARHAHRSAISSSNVDLTASDLAATSLSSSYAQQHQFHHMRSHPQPHTASSSAPLDASSNSLLDSRLSITESMLGDSNAIFHSASDHFATSSSTRPSGPPQ